MIDRRRLLTDLQRLVKGLVDGLRERTDQVDEVRTRVREQYSQAQAAGRTQRSYEEWREDLLAQVAVGWVLATVFVRFCEDNALVAAPSLSGPGSRRDLARDHQAAWLAQDPTAGDREWLEEVFRRYRAIPATAELFGERNPLWQFGPTADGARSLLELWWAVGDDSGGLRHDFTDPDLDTRFLGDLYQDLSEHAKKTYALLQTPEFVEEFILDRTLDPAIETFGLAGVRMIDPTCGSGHFLLGAFERILEDWRERAPGTPIRELVQRTLDAVNGVDVNPFAVAIARFRLLVAALRVAHIKELADAPAFRINVAVGDSLLHGRRTGRLFTGADEVGSLLDHRYPTEDEEAANRILESERYHTVVGNPPYITVKDPALSTGYRTLYKTCHRQYSLGVPFTERFFQLAQPGGIDDDAGYVGMITANSFMKREFGKKLIEEYLPTKDLTHVIDTSGAYIPGHGTPTVILFGRNQKPQADTVRAVLGIRGEPGRPEVPAKGQVWTSIMRQIDSPGAEGEYVSVEDASRARLARHPWSLQGGAAREVKELVERSTIGAAEQQAASIGITSFTLEDDAFLMPPRAARRRRLEVAQRPMVTGDLIRDWQAPLGDVAVFPYDQHLRPLADALPEPHFRHLWPNRQLLRTNKMFGGKTKVEAGLHWTEYGRLTVEKLRTPLSIVFAFVATHNHFVLDRGGKVFNRSAPVIKLGEGASEEEHLRLLGLLNSSTACFWMKQVFYPKGGDLVGQEGARLSKTAWEDRYEFDGTKLKQFPIPSEQPLERARELDGLAQRLSAALPAAALEREAPSRGVLERSRGEVAGLRARMVALQEELDWECYRLYGLVDEDLTLPGDRVPDLHKGERAFEIVLARKVAAGEATTTWFERHGSTRITEPPAHWPDEYRSLLERRIELIISDRSINLLERPEYKRRWNWESFDDLQRDALRDWLGDRLEARDLWAQPQVSTCARLADRVRRDAAFVEAARLYTGRTDVDIAALVTDLVLGDAVPFLADHRYKPSGLRKRRAWEHTWDLQRDEDAIDARTQLPPDHPEHLDAEGAALVKKEKGLNRIPVPPKYTSADFAKPVYWRLRGKLDVPKERFILYPGTHAGADRTSVIGWAGWDHRDQARALATHYHARKDEGGEKPELTGLLAGLAELLPWVKQWHNDLDSTGHRLGDFFDSFTDSEARGLGLTIHDLRTWTP